MTKLKINLTQGEIEIEGSEAIVREIYEDFKEKMSSFSIKPTDNEQLRENNSIKPAIETNTAEYEGNKYSIDQDGNVNIIMKVNGGNKAEKTQNTAAIYLFAKKSKGMTNDIVDLCKKQSCHDLKNFKSILKRASDKEKSKLFILKGKGKNQEIELTVPGKSYVVNELFIE